MANTPPYLKPGDTIGIVCPSGYMAAEKAQTCIQTLQEWGYNVKTGKTLGGDSTTYFSGTDEERLNDLQSMLDDREIKAILCGRGGYGLSRIIDRINFKKFSKHPKWVMGYSDITVLHSHIYTNYRISTLHSPMAAAFNDGGHASLFVRSLHDALQGSALEFFCPPHPFNREGKAKGELVGGNLALLSHLTGSVSDISTKGKILFLEDVGEYLYNLDRMLRQLKRSGKFDKIEGLIIGGFTDTKDTDRPFGKTAYEIVNELIGEYEFPVCFDFPVSHSDRNYAMKIGVPAKLNISSSGVRFRQ